MKLNNGQGGLELKSDTKQFCTGFFNPIPDAIEESKCPVLGIVYKIKK